MTSIELIVLLPWLLLSASLLAARCVISIAHWLRLAKVPRAWMVRR